MDEFTGQRTKNNKIKRIMNIYHKNSIPRFEHNHQINWYYCYWAIIIETMFMNIILRRKKNWVSSPLNWAIVKISADKYLYSFKHGHLYTNLWCGGHNFTMLTIWTERTLCLYLLHWCIKIILKIWDDLTCHSVEIVKGPILVVGRDRLGVSRIATGSVKNRFAVSR